MEDVDTFYEHLVYFVAIFVYFIVIWYIFPVLVCCTKKNLATLISKRQINNETFLAVVQSEILFQVTGVKKDHNRQSLFWLDISNMVEVFNASVRFSAESKTNSGTNFTIFTILQTINKQNSTLCFKT
jgi:hypothetical protein